MEKKSRYNEIKVRLTQEELDYLNHKHELSEIKSRNEFMKCVIFEGMILKINPEDYRYLVHQLRGVETNINQILRVAERHPEIDRKDIAEIKQKQEEIWQLLKSLRSSKLSVMH